MKVRRERPSQRLNHRVSAPIRVDIGDASYDVVDWSLGGFSLSGFDGPAGVGDVITVTIHVPFQGFEIAFAADGEIKRRGDNGDLGVAFVELGERERELMTHFIDSLVRGSMSVVDDTILRIDTPVTPVSTKPDPNPTEALPVRRWPFKALMMSAFYFSAGLAVLGYAFLVLHANFVRLEVQSAVVSAPVQPILATTDGLVKTVLIPQGDMVERHAPLMAFSNPVLRQRIDMARVRVDRALLTMRAKEKELDAERDKFGDYQLIAQSEVERITARIRSLQERAALARAQVERFTTLRREGWATQSKLDGVLLEYETLRGELEEARLLMHQRRALLDSIEAGRFFDGNRLEGRLQELQAVAELAADEVMLAKDELTTLLRQRDSLTIPAPHDGRMLALYKTNGATVKRGEQVALFERNEARTIEAYMTQEEVLEIGLGDEATAFFPSLDRKTRIVVTEIDRTKGYLDEVSSRYQWRGPKDRTAQVTLQFVAMPLNEVRTSFPPGLPVVVIFERRGTDVRFSTVKSWFQSDDKAGDEI